MTFFYNLPSITAPTFVANQTHKGYARPIRNA